MDQASTDLIASINYGNLVLYRYIILIIYVLGNVGNILSAIIFAQKSWRKNVCVLYFNACLLFNTFYINSTMLGSISMIGFNSNLFNTNLIVCKLYYYASFLFSIIFPTLLILASIDRLLISSQNVDTRLYSSKRLAYLSISVSLIIWAIFFCHLFIKVKILQLSPIISFCYFDADAIYQHFVSYFSLAINSTFIILMVILLVFAFKNVRRIRAIPRQQRHQMRLMTKKDFQLLRCLFVHDMVYIIFSIPISIFIVYAAVTAEQRRSLVEEAIINFISSLLNFLHHIPFCASFPIFICVSKAFRLEIQRFVYKIFAKDIGQVREEDNVQKPNIEVHVSVVLP